MPFWSSTFDPVRDMPDLTGKVALVSGATSGIGFETAQQLALHGAKVYVGARDEDKSRAAIARMEEKHRALKGSGLLQALKLDLTTVAGVLKDCLALLERETRLDIVINNAGVGLEYEIGSEGVEQMFAINHLGTFTVTQTLLPLLIKTAAIPGTDVRVVTVASSGQDFVSVDPKFASVEDFNAIHSPTLEAGNSFMGKAKRYGVSKFANVLFARHLQTRLLADPSPGANQIVSTSIHPGVVATEGGKRLAWFMKYLSWLFLTPEKGAATSLFAATASVVRDESGRYGGKYLTPYGKITQPNKLATDGLAATLWDTTYLGATWGEGAERRVSQSSATHSRIDGGGLDSAPTSYSKTRDKRSIFSMSSSSGGHYQRPPEECTWDELVEELNSESSGHVQSDEFIYPDASTSQNDTFGYEDLYQDEQQHDGLQFEGHARTHGFSQQQGQGYRQPYASTSRSTMPLPRPTLNFPASRPAPSSQLPHTLPQPPQLVRPVPVRPPPFIPPRSHQPPLPVASSSNAPPRSLPQSRTNLPKNTSYPVPLNGNTNRRRDEHLRPDGGGDPMQPRGASQRLDPQSSATRMYHAQAQAPPHPTDAYDQAYQEEDLFDDEDPGFEEALGSINTTPDIYRSIWKFGVLNAVQSTCFEEIYNTSNNVVVSAPTGSGKTALFELAIIRLLSMSSPEEDSKVVYMAPTKALCTERANDWRAKFASLRLGWGVAEITGDSGTMTSLSSVGSNRIIVTTPEKFDSMTRRWHSHEKLLSKLHLFCIDECHVVGMDVRGAVLEVVVSRFKALGTSTRFLALSATAPNIEDVGEWLGVNGTPATVFKFDESYRPCKLQKVVQAYHSHGNEWSFGSLLNSKLFDLIKNYSSGKPVLIFVSTRKACSQAAEALAKEYRNLLDKGRGGALPWKKPQKSTFKTSDKQLAALVELGIAYHHAGLENSDRRFVEEAFLDGRINIICATSTLAVGVNLPAHMVIIRGTKQYADNTFVEYSDLDILQMMGRAGRPQFDTSGVACIMTDTDMKQHYESLAKSETMLESCLHRNLTEHINSEITLKTVTSVESALAWLKETFLYVRITKNPSHYSLAGKNDLSPEERLEEIVTTAVSSLSSEGIIDELGNRLQSTEYGEVMSRYYLQVSTFLLLKNLAPKANMRTLLETLSSCTEFSSIRFRQGEKSVYTKRNKDLRFPCATIDAAAKVMIIIQLTLEGGSLNELKTGGVGTALKLLRSVQARAWDDSPTVLRQLDGVGEKSIKVLAEAGIHTLDDVRNSRSERLDTILNRNAPFGRGLMKQAAAFPQFEISIEAESETPMSTGVKVVLNVKVGLLNAEQPVVKKGLKRPHCSVLVLSSDGEYLDFRRMVISKLFEGGAKSFAISVILVKPSQRIFATISCDDLAGSEVRTTYKPSIAANKYPTPSIGWQVTDGEDEESEEEEVVAPPKKSAWDNRLETPKQKVVDDELQPRDDGRYDCSHACKDKSNCREGLEKPPKAKARKVAEPPKASQPRLDKFAHSSKAATPVEKKSLIKSESSKPPVNRPQPKATRVPSKKSRALDAKIDTLSSDDSDLPTIDDLFSKRRPSTKSSQHTSTRPPPAGKQVIAIDDEDAEVDEIDSPTPSPPSHPAPPPSLKRKASSISPASSMPDPKRSKAAFLFAGRSSSSTIEPASDVPAARKAEADFDFGLDVEMDLQLEPTPPPPPGPRGEDAKNEEVVPTQVVDQGESGGDVDAEFDDGLEDWLAQNVTIIDG
ncbi:hypothetical protein MNV49_003143 [Pseudohyphozyma bogoriensis]|nr:hypothetical protein MNV49_003143 [Pseudohyphozyma bogoriensis]